MYQILSGFFKTGMFKITSTSLSKSTSGLANVTQQISRSAKLLIVIFLIFAGLQGRAQRIASVTGNWNNTATWGNNPVPTSAETVTINPGINVTVDAASAAASSIVFIGTIASTLTINDQTLTVTGAVTLNSAAAANTAATITGTGTLSCGSLSVGTDATVSNTSTRTTILGITTAVVNVTNAITISGFQGSNTNRLNNTTLNINSGTVTAASVTVTNETTSTTASLILGASSPTLNISASTPFTQGANGTKVITLNGTGATVNYTGANQTVLATTYTNLGLSGTLAKTMTGVTTISGNFNMSGSTTANTVITSIGGNVSITETAAWTNGATNTTTGTLTVGTGATFTMGNFAYTNIGASSITGTVNTATGATGTRTFTGAVTINAGGVWDLSGQNPATSFAGGITMSGTTFNNGTGAASFSANQSLSGAVAMTFGGSVTPAASTTLTNINSSTVTINNIVLTGNFTQGSNTPTLSLVNAAPFTGAGTFDASTNANTVNYTGNSQTIQALTYNNLSFSAMTGTAVLASSGTITVTGSYTPTAAPTVTGSTVAFTGGDQTISGATTFNNLTIDGTPGGLKTILSNITVNGQMTFTSGYVVPSSPLAPQTVIFTANGVVNGTANNNSFIRGCNVQKVVSASFVTDLSIFTFPVGGSSKGYRPISIGSVTAPTTFTASYKAINALSLTPSIPYFQNQFANTLTAVSDFEYWDLGHSSTAGSINAAVTLNWAPYPATDASYVDLRLAHFDGSQWENLSGASGPASFDSKTITVNGVSSFSPFTMGSISAAALPVTLTSFTAKPTPDNKVSLAWVTSSEQVNKGFRIERQTATETGKFAQIGFVATKAKDGNSQSMLTYNFIDNAPKMGASSFYRLVQEDLDGKLTYSDIRAVRLNGQSVSMVFPNPSNGVVNISRTADGKKMNIQVIDQSGKIVSQAFNITDANYTMSILQSGFYSVKLMYPETGEQSIQRIVVQR